MLETSKNHIKQLQEKNRILLREIESLEKVKKNIDPNEEYLVNVDLEIKSKLLTIQVHNEVIRKIKSGELQLNDFNFETLESKMQHKKDLLFESLLLTDVQIKKAETELSSLLNDYALTLVILDKYETIPSDKKELERYNKLEVREGKLYLSIRQNLGVNLELNG